MSKVFIPPSLAAIFAPQVQDNGKRVFFCVASSHSYEMMERAESGPPNRGFEEGGWEEFEIPAGLPAEIHYLVGAGMAFDCGFCNDGVCTFLVERN